MNKKEKRCSADANVTAPALMIFLAGNRRGNAKRHTPSKNKATVGRMHAAGKISCEKFYRRGDAAVS
jgi:hypothetical protein